MIDPLLQLAFALHSSKGVYALLLGSGVSRSAGILTGWEIVLDLTRKVAASKGENCEPDPAAWYAETFGVEPDYAKLLAVLGKTRAERSQLLRPYFEPTEEEREQGIKVPTPAHKAIAELVRDGYVRIVITTNFDRLLEEALAAAGVVPTVISRPDAIEGALPLSHIAACVLKVHGDYLDTRIKNTPEELSKYDKRINRFLDRILDEFGLVVCGWSAEWDEALRAAVERCRSRRFTTFWADPNPGQAAERLIALRGVEKLQIRDADSFFTDLVMKVRSLEAVARPHPLSAAVAVATLKRMLRQETQPIAVHDLVMTEARRLRGAILDRQLPNGGPDGERLQQCFELYEGLSEVMRGLIIAGCYSGGAMYDQTWVDCLETVTPPKSQHPQDAWQGLRRYPALILLYAGGIAALAAEKYTTLAALLTKVRITGLVGEAPAVIHLYPWEIWRGGVPSGYQPVPRVSYTLVSERLCAHLRESFAQTVPDHRYEPTFDRFEYLHALVRWDLWQQNDPGPQEWFGCFIQRNSWDKQREISALVQAEIDAAEAAWAPLRAGLFGGSVDRLKSVRTQFDDMLQRHRQSQLI